MTSAHLRPHLRPLLVGAVAVALYQVCFSTGTARTGIALAVVGIACIARSQPGDRTDLVGVVAALGAGLARAVSARIGQERIRAGLDWRSCTAAMFLGGAVVSLPLLGVGSTRDPAVARSPPSSGGEPSCPIAHRRARLGT